MRQFESTRGSAAKKPWRGGAEVKERTRNTAKGQCRSSQDGNKKGAWLSLKYGHDIFHEVHKEHEENQINTVKSTSFFVAFVYFVRNRLRAISK
ncbi:hypothetical protein [Nevskia sp.]|uniref:hypothetical protein n=1 Tax=Nevskia sp. TaxID=1929292 RepID=UPI0025D41618|nr:hypothetical protein [Nevskia sp.]